MGLAIKRSHNKAACIQHRLISCLFILLHVCVGGSEDGKHILVLGGNGFIGSHTVNALLEEGFNITLLNRKNNYFNSNRQILPYVQRVISCDRSMLLRSTCPEILEGHLWYDVVIDFSSYRPEQIEQILDILQNRVGLYIFVSSDAVYEVSEKHHGSKTREEDSKNDIQNKEKRNQLIEANAYGQNKKLCEERLITQRKRFGFPYLIFRLSDVIGEKDTTYRWWNYQLWMKLHESIKVPIPLPQAIRDEPFSMVYVKDVARAVVDVVTEPELFYDKVINLAFKEDITLGKILEFMSKYYNISNASYDTDEETAWFKFPTTHRGPVDIKNAEILLEWNPTGFLEAAKHTCDFFELMMVDPLYAKDRELLLAEFIEETLPDSFTNEDLLIQSLIDAFSPAVFKGIDVGISMDETQNQIASFANKEL